MIFASLSIPTELLASLVIAGDANDNVASRFDIQQLAVESIGNLGLMCEAFRRQRNPSIDKEDVIVDVRRAVLEFGSEKWCRVNSELPKDAWMPLSGLYECGGGRYVRMHCNFEHHKVAALKAVSRLAQTSLSNSIERTACEDLVKTLDANELEREASLVGAVIASVRARAEFVAHAQHHTLRQTRLCDLKQQTNLVDANVTASSHALAPLANIRILNLTRVLAGPVCCRALAAWGADVVRTSCHTVPEFDGT
jgi:crotonobetainyl-CoA:carnitine CoA-transferase CaiB-like acyl-CoA transferase